MNYLKKRIRKNFAKNKPILQIPYLLTTQHNGYKSFLTINNIDNKNNIKSILESFFPIKSINNNIILHFISYKFTKSIYTSSECKMRGISYNGILSAIFKLEFIKNKKKNIQKNIFLGEIPIMTNRSTFIINGTERVIVSQLHRSPGVFFSLDKNNSSLSNKVKYNAKIIPARGSWISFVFDSKDLLFVKIEGKKKLLVTILLKALKFTNEKILLTFFEFDKFYLSSDKIIMELIPQHLKGQIASFNFIKDNFTYIKEGKIISSQNIQLLLKNNITHIEVPKQYLINKIVAKNYLDINTGELICLANTKLSLEIIDKLIKANIPLLEILFINNLDHGAYISKTLQADPTKDYISALKVIYKHLKGVELFSKVKAEQYLHKLLFSTNKYDLSIVGRKKINLSLLQSTPSNKLNLTIIDIIKILSKLINIKNGLETIDDIDNLGNRRIKSLAELLSYHFRLALLKIEKNIKQKINDLSIKKYTRINLQNIFNSKIITLTMKEFFTSSQLSQFMDQTNPLSEITHKRRISALGPGGITRDRAGFEVRDIHPSHYGRMCPVETPEGPNIGLINSLAIYAKVNEYGFLVTPYQKVINGKITSKIDYLTADEEKKYHIAQANNYINKNSELDNKLHVCRFNEETILVYKNEVDYIDISTLQLISIGTSLIPFVGHDDANRALMGTNMQRQAVPLLNIEKPLVGTGIEYIVAKDSGMNVYAKRGGFIFYLDNSKIIVKVNNNEINKKDPLDIGYDIYYLIKNHRSNQNTFINQRPCVNLKEVVNIGDLLIDSNATDLGELALGQNVRIAFMSWYGYNFEDSIVISDQLIKDNKFTSLHIEELICIVRDTKLGEEKITIDIPNINEEELLFLDKEGIIIIGSKVKENDILIGKVSPKVDIQLSSEKKLLYAVFGKKVSDVKDSSLRVPLGIEGTVIDVQVFTREGCKKDKRAIILNKLIVNNSIQKMTEEFKLLRYNIIISIKKLLDNYSIDNITKYLLKNKFKKLNSVNLIKQNKLLSILSNYKLLKKKFNNNLKSKLKKINNYFELSAGILKLVKVFIASKRHIQPGDKMSGRHGNKGVVSRICPREDMPYDKFGIPVDIILNPLGVPSRMNVGQILETHLGLAAKGVGKVINRMLKQQQSVYKIRSIINHIYNSNDNLYQKVNFDNFSDKEILTLANNLCEGLPVATPVFDGATEQEIKSLLKLGQEPITGKITLFDGCTGERIKQKVTVGYMYMLKLNHLVEDKIHARSTGSYSLITQQPLGGKSQFGGQRLGEMEVWALEAYGAAYTLQEMLTVKSDDIKARTIMYHNILNENFIMNSNIPESFNVLIKEIKALGLNIEYKNLDNLNYIHNNISLNKKYDKNEIKIFKN